MGLLDILRGGIPIVFISGAREIAELRTYEVRSFVHDNKIETRIRLHCCWSEKFGKENTTGWWFKPEDFDPALPSLSSDGTIPWDDLGATVIVCFRSWNGQTQWDEEKIMSLQERLKTLGNYIQILRKESIQLINILESSKLEKNKMIDEFKIVEALASMKKIVLDVKEEENVKKSDLPAWLN